MKPGEAGGIGRERERERKKEREREREREKAGEAGGIGREGEGEGVWEREGSILNECLCARTYSYATDDLPTINALVDNAISTAARQCACYINNKGVCNNNFMSQKKLVVDIYLNQYRC